MSTSKAKMVWRVSMIPWKLVLCVCLLLGVMPTIGMLVVVIGSVALMMWGCAVGVRLLGQVFYGDDPDYQTFRASGGDPYWSLLPPPINTDSLAVRAGGIPEPQTDFVPPSDWLIQCPCGARNEDHGICWHCGKNLSGRVSIPAPSANYTPRTAECPGCNKLVREIEFGKFEHGVRCPYCATVMQIVPVAPDPTALPRTMDCDQCRRIIREPYYGAFETRVTCSCGRIMFAAPRAV